MSKNAESIFEDIYYKQGIIHVNKNNPKDVRYQFARASIWIPVKSVRAAKMGITHYAKHDGLRAIEASKRAHNMLDTAYPSDDIEDGVCNAVRDLLHLCQETGINFDHCVAMGRILHRGKDGR